MRSEHVDRFNHDEDAPGYDENVTRESDPIRAGYADVLDWVASFVTGGDVLDLGTGTGNLVERIPGWRHLVAVDVSREMTAIARTKLASRRGIEFVGSDILEYFDEPRGPYDAVVSTYTIHHLTDDEKTLLFDAIARSLRPGGVAAFGDLMFADPEAREAFIRTCPEEDLVYDVHDEYFWDVARASRELASHGLVVETRRFSSLSWGIAARKPRRNAERTPKSPETSCPNR